MVVSSRGNTRSSRAGRRHTRAGHACGPASFFGLRAASVAIRLHAEDRGNRRSGLAVDDRAFGAMTPVMVLTGMTIGHSSPWPRAW